MVISRHIDESQMSLTFSWQFMHNDSISVTSWSPSMSWKSGPSALLSSLGISFLSVRDA